MFTIRMKSITWNSFLLLQILLFAGLQADDSSEIKVVYEVPNENKEFEVNFQNLLNAKILKNDLRSVIKSLEDTIEQLDNFVFTEISFITKNKPLSKQELNKIEVVINNTRTNIATLSSQISTHSNNIRDLKKRSISIQEDIDKLNKKLANKTNLEYQLLREYFDSNFLFENYKNLLEEKENLDRRLEDAEQTKLADDCIGAIESGNLVIAEIIIDSIKNDSKIAYIVEHLNFNDILKLGFKVKNITKCFIIYSNVKYELLNVEENLQLLMSIKNEIMEQLNSPAKIRLQADQFITNIKNVIKETIHSDSESYCGLDTMTYFHRLIELDSKLAAELLDGISSLICKSYTHVYGIYNKNCYKFKNDIINNIRTSKKYALNFITFAKNVLNNVESCYLDVIDEIIEELPTIIKNMLFTEKLCLSKPNDQQYLHSAGNTYDNLRYTVYTQTKEYVFLPGDVWNLEHVKDNIFIIRNNEFNNSYLDTPIYDKDDNGHNVYLWLETAPNCGQWKFEFDDSFDYVYIKHHITNEYLYTSTDTNQFAYTKHTNDRSNSDFQWMITDCTEFEQHF